MVALFRGRDSQPGRVREYLAMGKSSKRPTMVETLRQLIQDSEQSVNALAKASGVAQPILHRFLKGEQGLTLTSAQKLADHFDLELRPRR